MAGELSLLSALSAGHLMRAHMALNRKPAAAAASVGAAAPAGASAAAGGDAGGDAGGRAGGGVGLGRLAAAELGAADHCGGGGLSSGLDPSLEGGGGPVVGRSRTESAAETL